MRNILILLTLCLVVAHGGEAEKSLPSDAAKYVAECDDAILKARKALMANLNKSMVKATKAGDLDGANAIKGKMGELEKLTSEGKDLLGDKLKQTKPTLLVVNTSSLNEAEYGSPILVSLSDVTVSVSSTYPGYDPLAAFPGSKGVKGWATKEVGNGSYSVAFKVPISTQRVVIYGRHTLSPKDSWGNATITINGQSASIANFCGSKSIVVDFGNPVSIEAIIISAKDGTQYPGIDGFAFYK